MSEVLNLGDSVQHAALVIAGAAWLQKKKFPLIITEMAHSGAETPDAIGWRGGHSTLIECKVSRADFLADQKKSFRRRPEDGMGCTRYFCTLRSLIRTEELPDGWGLLEWDGQRLLERVKAAHRCKRGNAREEVRLLLSAIRRIGHQAPKGVSVRCYDYETKNRATIGLLRATEEPIIPCQ